MNSSKDLRRKPLKRINKRKKNGRGFFPNSHSYNLISRNGSLPSRSMGYPDHVLQNPNRSFNIRLHNSGFLKHIHSQSIRREKEHSTVSGYEEYTLRKIRSASDMIKQQLMSPEHTPVSSTETSIDTESTESRNKSNRLSGETSKMSDNNTEYPHAKMKRKVPKSSEEIFRLQKKQRRKNELREKFKRDNNSEQKSNETHDPKEISDQILKHISKMNNERIMDFLNVGDSLYGEAFTLICKRKSFEVSKALRDLSLAEKPADCEIVNAIIPDFSIKIEQLPINVIKELSSTFDELQKNIGNSYASDENCQLFGDENELQSSDDLSAFLEQFYVKTESQIDNGNRGVIINNLDCGNIDLIEISDDEHSQSKDDDNVSMELSQIADSSEEAERHCPPTIDTSSNHNTAENDDPSNLPSQPDINSDQLIHPNSEENINPSHLQHDFDEILNETSDTTYQHLMDSFGIEMNSQEDIKPILPEIPVLNSQPKVGSVWVSKSIFETSNCWNDMENNIPEQTLDSANEQNIEPQVASTIEDNSEMLENFISVQTGQDLNKDDERTDEIVEVKPDISEICISTLPQCSSNVGLTFDSSMKDNTQLLAELTDKNDTSDDANRKESGTDILQTSGGLSNIPTVNRDLPNLLELAFNNSASSSSTFRASNIDKDDKDIPNNRNDIPNSVALVCNNFSNSGNAFTKSSSLSEGYEDQNDIPNSLALACNNFSSPSSVFGEQSSILALDEDLVNRPNSFELCCNNFSKELEVIPVISNTNLENDRVKESNKNETFQNNSQGSCNDSDQCLKISTVTKDKIDSLKSFGMPSRDIPKISEVFSLNSNINSAEDRVKESNKNETFQINSQGSCNDSDQCLKISTANKDNNDSLNPFGMPSRDIPKICEVFSLNSNINPTEDRENESNKKEISKISSQDSCSVSGKYPKISTSVKGNKDVSKSFGISCENLSSTSEAFSVKSNTNLSDGRLKESIEKETSKIFSHGSFVTSRDCQKISKVYKGQNDAPKSLGISSKNVPKTSEVFPVKSNFENSILKESGEKEILKINSERSDCVSSGCSEISMLDRDKIEVPKSIEITSKNSLSTPKIIPENVNTVTENDFISLTIKPFDKPKNLKDAIKKMNVIDEHIQMLTKLRQDIFINLSENITNTELPQGTKRKLEGSADLSEMTVKKMYLNEVVVEKQLEETNSNNKKSNAKDVEVEKGDSVPGKGVQSAKKSGGKVKKKKSGANELAKEKDSGSCLQNVKMPEKPKQDCPKPFERLDVVNDVVLFCKILFDKEECVLGTDNGKIQYHSIYGKKASMTVTVGSSAISFLECLRINDRFYIFTGTVTESEIKILKYKKKFVDQRVHLEDSIQAVRNEWGFFFIGGERGYLTRYDWRKDRVQFEDSISADRIKDLAPTKEGPRKILVILFEDKEGVAHIHVRDAMTALHIRTIIDMKNVRSMYLRFSSVYVLTDEQISLYNCCNGNFIRKITTQQPFSLVKSKGHLLILGGTDGIYGYNMKTNRYLGCLKGDISPTSLFTYEQKIICGTLSKKVEVFDVPDVCKDLLEYK